MSYSFGCNVGLLGHSYKQYYCDLLNSCHVTQISQSGKILKAITGGHVWDKFDSPIHAWLSSNPFTNGLGIIVEV